MKVHHCTPNNAIVNVFLYRPRRLKTSTMSPTAATSCLFCSRLTILHINSYVFCFRYCFGYLFKNGFSRVKKLQKLANSRHFLSQKLQKIGTGPRVSFLNLVVYLLDYHLPLMVVLDRFEVVKNIELKIDHKLKK